jgi:phospholipid/cholesterol/gamma-HCH transport system substrate-binding protein
MNESGYRFGVGVLVLSSIVIGILLVAFFGAIPDFWTDRYKVIVNFEQAPGVSDDTPVRKNGVQIGRVSEVELLSGDDGVNLTFELESKYKISYLDLIMIKSGSIITGDAIIEFMSVGQDDPSLLKRFDGITGLPDDGFLQPEELEFASDSFLKQGDYIDGGAVEPDPMAVIVDMQSNFGSTLTAIEGASRKVESLASSFEQVLGGGSGDFANVMQRAQTSLDRFNEAAATVNRVALQVERSEIPDILAKALDRLPGVIAESEAFVKKANQTLAVYDDVGRSFEEVGRTANSTMQNIEDITEPFVAQSDAIAGELRATVGDVRKTVIEARSGIKSLELLANDLRVLTGRINNSQGTVGRLIDDDRLYFQLVQTLQNIESTSRNIEDVTGRLRPIVDDARIVSDKLARDPSQLFRLNTILSGRPSGAGGKY